MKTFSAFVRKRALLISLTGCLGIGARLSSATPHERSLPGLAELLGDAVESRVEPSEIAWEPSPGFWAETFLGRPVLFLAKDAEQGTKDLFRARVRLTLDGSPLSVTQLRNLTDTPHGDDVALEAAGNHVMFATLAFGRIQTISVLETPGIREADRPRGVWDRLLLSLSSFQRTGSFRGIGRTDIVLDVPAESARLTLDTAKLAVDFGQRGRALVYDLERRLLRSAEGGEAYAARALPQVHGEKPLIFWLVDTVRAEVGPAPIAWLEKVVFGARDSVRKTTYSLFSSERATVRADADQATTRVLEAGALAQGQDSFPPQRIPSLWERALVREGEWEAVIYSFLQPLPLPADHAGQPPPYFYRTFIRPDVERPYAKVHLVAMDMRQLEIGMQAGYEDPKPTTGAPGEGRLPRDPNVYERVVATFNGAFKTTHGEYGMMVDRRVLLPPQPGGASIVVDETRRVGLGTWPESQEIPSNFVSFRQNLDPLVEDGIANPKGRHEWGWQLEGTSVMTQRSAICLNKAGHLYYAWGDEIDGKTLGKALGMAGCSYAIHLDMNPGHCAFVFTRVKDPKSGDMTVRLLHDDMRMNPERFVRWSAKDFFYVMVRKPVPEDDTYQGFAPDAGTQPPPAWLPGIFSAKTSVGSLEVELFSVENGRVDFRVRAGTREFGGARRQAVGRGFADDQSGRALAAIGLGHTTEATRYGLAYGAEALSPLKANYATLILQDGEAPRVFTRAPPELTSEQQAVQLPLLAADGVVAERARERGELRHRSALCVTASGRTLLARTHHDSSDGLAVALLARGCRDVLELDRGSHHPAFLHRAGTATPPVDSYEASALYLLGRPMTPSAYHWKPQPSAAAKPAPARAPVSPSPADQ